MQRVFAAALVAAFAYAPWASAQSVPAEALRAGPTPPRVEPHEPIAFAREFAAAREGETLRMVYTENGPGGRATLRSALLRAEGSALLRARDDLTLAPDARTIALAWSNGVGAVAYVVPRRPAPPRPPGARRPRRAPVVGVPASTRDPLGPSNLSGGEVVVRRLDAEGRAVGEPVTLFTENARLTRLSAAFIGQRLVVAWTGGAVTDDEVRVTVRARSIAPDGALTRAIATHSGLLGDIGDVLEITPGAAGGADLWVSASHCAAITSATYDDPPADPSERISPPRRSLMPQQPTQDAPGAPVRCGPFTLYRVRLDARDDVRETRAVAPLARDLATRSGTRWAALVPTASGPSLALIDADALTVRGADGAALRPAAPTPRAQDLSLRAPAPDDPPLVEAPVPPPDQTQGALERAAIVAQTSRGELIAVADGRRVIHRRAVSGEWSVLARAPRGVAAISVLGGANDWLIAREGQWSGAVRWSPLAPGGGAVDWPERSPVRAQPAAPQRFAMTAPYVWDEDFARLWTRARTARAVFMRHENTAGAMAARPEAPGDPRMPGVIAVRNRLRNRWESVCGQLRARARQLAREGAGDDVNRGVQQLCELHADLQLGVPVNPAL